MNEYLTDDQLTVLRFVVEHPRTTIAIVAANTGFNIEKTSDTLYNLCIRLILKSNIRRRVTEFTASEYGKGLLQ